MIVSCEKCSTQFQLDETRVPDEGVRVRCSRCKHAFFVKKKAGAGRAVERVVERTVEASEGAGASPAVDRSSDAGVEESDWQFNDERSAHDAGGAADPPGLDAGGPSDGGDAFGEVDLGPSGLDLAGGPAGDVEDEIDSLLGRDSDDASADLGGDSGPEPEPPGSDLTGAAGDPLADLGDESPFADPLGDAREAAPGSELGSPENWDFDEAEEERAPAAPGMRIAIGRIGTTRVLARPPVEVDAEPSAVVIWLGRCAQAAGWLVVALLVGVALYGLAVPRPDAVGAVAAEPSRVAGVEIAELQGRWLENAVAGPMYVVSGRLENPSTHLVTTEGRLALRLLDARGGVVDGDAAPVGLPLPEPQLRADDPRELQARLGMESRTLARVPFEPGASRRFQAVLPAPPDAALRFDLVSLPLDQAPAAPAT